MLLLLVVENEDSEGLIDKLGEYNQGWCQYVSQLRTAVRYQVLAR